MRALALVCVFLQYDVVEGRGFFRTFGKLDGIGAEYVGRADSPFVGLLYRQYRAIRSNCCSTGGRMCRGLKCNSYGCWCQQQFITKKQNKLHSLKRLEQRHRSSRATGTLPDSWSSSIVAFAYGFPRSLASGCWKTDYSICSRRTSPVQSKSCSFRNLPFIQAGLFNLKHTFVPGTFLRTARNLLPHWLSTFVAGAPGPPVGLLRVCKPSVPKCPTKSGFRRIL